MKRLAAVLLALGLILLVAWILARIAAPGYAEREIAARAQACREQGYAAYDAGADLCREPRDPDAPPTAAPEL